LFACGVLFLSLSTGIGRAEKPITGYSPAAQALYKKAQQLFDQGRFREALDAYDQAQKEGMRDYPLIEVQRGECLRQLKEYARAIETLSRSIEEGTLGQACRH
jgi:tetratricopeptide (TPR) repeat protein